MAMTLREWIGGTTYLLNAAKEGTSPKPWQSEFLLLDADARKYITNHSESTLRPLIASLYVWKQRVREELGAMYDRLAVKALSAEVDIALNGRACDTLRVEAQRILAQFRSAMSGEYANKLHAVFIAPNPPVQNFTWHKNESLFQSNFTKSLGNSAHEFYPVFGFGSANAFTIPVTGRSKEYPDINDPSNPPGNRVIELAPAFEDGTVRHELLHWSTHQTFEDIGKSRPKEIRKVIYEGITEYFTRSLEADPQRQNHYDDEYATISAALTANLLSKREVEAAYFRGENAAAVMDKIDAFVQEQLRQAPIKVEWNRFYILPKVLSVRKEVKKLPDDLKRYLAELPSEGHIDQLKTNVPKTSDSMIAAIKVWWKLNHKP